MKYCIKFLLYLFALCGFSLSQAGIYEDFFKAVELDLPRSVSQILERGFDPNSPNNKGQVGLYLALRDDSPQVAAVLLASPRLKVDAANLAGETPLMMAALRGNLEWTQRLIDRGAQVNRDGWTPLHYAASGPEPKVVSLLLDRGALIDALAPNKSTALMMAAGYGALDSTPLLLMRGANPRLRNDAGLNAADFARTADREKLAERLDALSK